MDKRKIVQHLAQTKCHSGQTFAIFVFFSATEFFARRRSQKLKDITRSLNDILTTIDTKTIFDFPLGTPVPCKKVNRKEQKDTIKKLVHTIKSQSHRHKLGNLKNNYRYRLKFNHVFQTEIYRPGRSLTLLV